MVRIGDPAVEDLKRLAADPEIQYPQQREFYLDALRSIGTPAALRALEELKR
jgi:hypothetical protein